MGYMGLLSFYWGYIEIMEKKMETIVMGYIGYRTWGIWESYYNLLKAILYLLKGDYRVSAFCAGGFLGSCGILKP